MRIRLFFCVLLIMTVFGDKLFAQMPAAAQVPAFYKLPDSYHFDYDVEQVISSKKSIGDSCVMHFLYTKSGEYAAASMQGKTNMKGKLFIVLTRDGSIVLFDDHRKTVTIVSLRKMMSDMTGMMKWIRMDSVFADMKRKMDRKDMQSVKTGNTKQIGNYTTEEYTVTDSKGHKGSVWLAKVDFDTQADYMMGSVGGNFLKMMSSNMTQHPLFQALTQPKTLVTYIQIKDSAGNHSMNMHTVSINPVSTNMSTSGYTVDDYSNMTLPEIFQAEMSKRND